MIIHKPQQFKQNYADIIFMSYTKCYISNHWALRGKYTETSRELLSFWLRYEISRDLACESDGVEGVGEGEGYPQRCCVIFWKIIYLNKNGRRRERRRENVSVNCICSPFQNRRGRSKTVVSIYSCVFVVSIL